MKSDAGSKKSSCGFLLQTSDLQKKMPPETERHFFDISILLRNLCKFCS